MNYRPTPLLAILSLLVALALLFLLTGRFGSSAQLQESALTVDPAVLDALQTQDQVEVYIALEEPTLPLLEQSIAYRQQYAADIQARVLSILTAADFTLIYQFPLSPSLSGWITSSGLDRLAGHPDVKAIELPTSSTIH